MATTAGALSQSAVGSTTDTLVSAVATGGTAPYTYQWYRSTTSGFTPGGGNIITGATSLTLNDSGLIPNTVYYYKVVATDSGAVSGTSAQLVVTTTPPSLSQNAIYQPMLAGVPDLGLNMNTVSAQIDTSAGTNLYYWGQAVKLVANTAGGTPKVVGVTSKTDAVWGFLLYDVKSQSFGAGQNVEVSRWGNCIWLYATGAITQGAQVCVDPTSPAGVQATGNSATIVGEAYDGAAGAGNLIRVLQTPNPSYATA